MAQRVSASLVRFAPLRIIWTDGLDPHVLAELPLLREIDARAALESAARQLLALLNSPAAMKIDYLLLQRRLFFQIIPEMLQAVALLPQLRSLSLVLHSGSEKLSGPLYPNSPVLAELNLSVTSAPEGGSGPGDHLIPLELSRAVRLEGFSATQGGAL